MASAPPQPIAKTQAVIAAARVNTLLDEAQAARPQAQGRVAAGEVDIRRLSFAYGEGSPVLREVDLRIAPGEFIGIVGPTGSGKSTLLSLLLRFYPVSQGALCIDGQPIVGEPFEHAGPVWGAGNRTYTISPDGEQVALPA